MALHSQIDVLLPVDPTQITRETTHCCRNLEPCCEAQPRQLPQGPCGHRHVVCEARDPETGEVRQRFPSLSSVYAAGYARHLIEEATTKGTIYRGFTWHRCQHLLGARFSRSRPVEAYNLATGRLQERYPSLEAAMRDGHSQWKIKQALSGTRREHHGYGWREVGRHQGTPSVTIKPPKMAAAPAISYEACDAQTGKVLGQFADLTEAARAGFRRQEIRNAINSGLPYEGFLWRHGKPAAGQSTPGEEQPTPVVQPAVQPAAVTDARPVVARAPYSKEVVYRYANFAEAAAESGHADKLHKALRSGKCYLGLLWSYTN